LSAVTVVQCACWAGTFVVTNLQDSGPGSLRNAILSVNGAAPGPQVIDARSVTGTITLASSLPVVTAEGMTILGPGPGNLTIDGANQYQAFFIGVSVDAAAQGSLYPTTNSQISVSGLTIAHTLAQGGAGGVNAGGGAGLGGALFVNAGNVVISNLMFIGNSANGGAGGGGISTSGTLTQTGGGGGGLGGNGANGGSTTNSSAGGGGGGFGYGASGSSQGGNAGTGTFAGAASGGSGGNYGTPGGISGGGGVGPPFSTYGGGGGGGGVAGGAGQAYFIYTNTPPAFHGAGGAAGFGGGGGGGGGYQIQGNSDGGAGGFGGGGGGAQQLNYGGNGGFGGGAGSGVQPGAIGFGGGSATNQVNGPSAGGGGLGAGGAIFVRQGANLTIMDCNFTGNTVAGGAGGADGALAGQAGSALGQALFLGASVTNSVSGANVVVLSDNIGGGNDTNAAGGLVETGSGTLVLAGTNSYVGPTTLAGGVLEVDGDISSSSTLTVGSGTTVTGSGIAGETVINSGAVAPGPGVTALATGDVTWNGSGNFNWKVYDAAGAPGTGYDVLNVNGVLDLTGATLINLNLRSLSSASPVTTGNAINFNNAESYSWTLIHTTYGIIRFNPSKFQINTTANNGTGGFSNPLGSGVFSLAVVGTDLVLQFTAQLSVVTEPASNITAENATLNATVNPNGTASAVFFEWGTTTNYGNTTPVTNVGAGTSAVAVSNVVNNLAPGATYHYQAVATNSAGILLGGDVTFTTLRTNAALAGLTLSSGPITPPFDPGTTAYNASVNNSITSVTVTPTSADSAATIQVGVNGGALSPVLSGSPSSALALNVGTNTIAIVVTAQDGVTMQTYSLTVTRALSSNAALAGLTLNAGPITPSFGPSITNYTVTVSNSFSAVTVTPTAADNTATIQVQVNGGPLSAVPSGSASGPLPVNVGGNVINVVVTAQDGVTTQTYTLSVSRVGPPQATTQPASGISGSNATLNASVIADGLLTTAYFEWGPTTSYGNTTTPTGIGSGTSPIAVNAAVSGLLPGATYHFAILASNSVGTVSGADSSFTIPAMAPAVTTLAASSITSASATANASVNPNGATTTVYFQWGTNTSYGSTSSSTSAGSGNSDVPIGIALGNLLPGTTYHFVVVASNNVGVVSGTDQSFTTLASAPVATSLAATGVAVSNATLNATVNPNGGTTTAYFVWGTTTSYGNTAGQTNVGAGTTAVAVNAPITNLLPGVTYHYALFASNSVGSVTSADATLTTPAMAPAVTTLAATNITSASATANASVDPNGAATTVYFQWGTNTSYGSTSSSTSAGSGNSDVPIGIALGNLLPGTTYHYAVIASNSVGIVSGTDIAFTTLASAPVATSLAATGVAVSNATLNATVNPNGGTTTAYFVWGTTTSYGNTAGQTNVGAGTTAVAVNAPITNLLPGVTYHYALFASNSVGSVTSADATLTTPAMAPAVTTLAATNITSASATANASVDPNGAATTVYFQWGTNTSYGSTSSSTSAGSGNSAVSIGIALGNLLPGTTYHYAVIASNSVGIVSGTDIAFTTLASAPVATSLAATGVAVSNATLNATVNPNGATTTVYFVWGTTTSYGNTAGQTNVGAGTTAVAVNAPITNLLPGVTYHYALFASNSVGSVTSADATLTTPAMAPSVTTLAASGITSASATANASVDPNGAATTVYFQWGTNTSYGSTSSSTSAGSGNSAVSIGIALGNLLPGTTYHYAVIASNSVGIVSGTDIAFTTLASAPAATTLSASGIGPRNATLNGSVNPNGAPTFVSFAWGTNTSYSSITSLMSVGGGNTAIAVNAALTNLLPSQTYHFAIMASNSVGTVTGADAVFTTASMVPSATTLPATSISVGNATLNGSVNPNGGVTSVYFQWGTTTAYGNATPLTVVGSGLAALPVSASVSGWSAGVTYHYRVAANNGVGTVYGADRQFGAPSVTLNGPNPLTNECGAAFEDPGATATGFVGLAQETIAAGTTHSLALQANSIVVGWGSNQSGETSIPAQLSNVVSVAAGNDFSLALLYNGAVDGWGTNLAGQVSVPAGLSNVVSIAAGNAFGLALQGNGTVIGWGDNTSNQTNVPAGLSNVVAIAAGADFGLALETNGLVVGWGDNSSGQTTVPGGLSSVVAIAAGASHGLALESNGTVIGWGDNTGGETNVPVGLSNVVAIAAGNEFSLALEDNGTVVAWGTNSSGQIAVPAGVANAVEIAAGNDFALALLVDGTVIGWGDNSNGETVAPTNLVAALPQEPILGDLTAQITLSGTINATQLGAQQLTYTVVAALGTTNSATRSVVVVDTTPPQISCPADMLQVLASGQESVEVNFETPAAQDQCSTTTVVCAPASGSLFAGGTNLVTCVATDTSSNSASCTFHVIVDTPPTVNAGPSQLITLPQNTVQLNGSVTDLGLLNPLIVAWSKLSGPGNVVFGNAGTVTTTASFSTNGTYVLELAAGDGLASATSQVTIVVHAPPVITQPPTVAGALSFDGTLVLPSGEPVDFTVAANEAGGNPLSYLWSFGNGATSTNQNPTFTFTNCQPQVVTVTISDGITSTNQSVAVQPACEMTVHSELAHVSFKGKRLDRFGARGFINLPADFAPAGMQVAVEAGNVQQIFRLDVKGRSANAAGTLHVHHIPHKTWSFSVNFKGDFASEWAGNGLTNATVRNATVHVPLFFIFNTNPLLAYTSSPALRYTATNGEQGTATIKKRD
jgi:hypothetical protein